MGLLRRLFGGGDDDKPEEEPEEEPEPELEAEPAEPVDPNDPSARLDAARERLREEIPPIEDGD